MTDIKNLTKQEFVNEVLKLGGKKFNAIQIFEWIYKKRSGSFEIMTNLSKPLRVLLLKVFYIGELRVLKKQISANKDTVKYLFKLEDGNKIETVLMKQSYGNTVCISTQAGCGFNCIMCATGKIGFIRNLTTSEIISQLLFVEKEENEPVKNIVFMGMGEPLANYDNFKKSVEILEDKDGLSVNYKRMTVSTCGLVPKIEKMVEDDFKINLAVSLHSVLDKTRDVLVPVNKKYNLRELFLACKKYYQHFKMQVTFEYALIKGLNDSEENCNRLIDFIEKYNLPSKVNLIPVNTVKFCRFKPSGEEVINMWQGKLENAKIIATVRTERGADINAACGQLAGGIGFEER